MPLPGRGGEEGVSRSLVVRKGSPLAWPGGSLAVRVPQCHRQSREPRGNWKVIKSTLCLCHFQGCESLPFAVFPSLHGQDSHLPAHSLRSVPDMAVLGSVPSADGLTPQSCSVPFQEKGGDWPRQSLLTSPVLAKLPNGFRFTKLSFWVSGTRLEPSFL